MAVLTFFAVVVGLLCGLVVAMAAVLLVIVGVNDKRWRAEHADHPSGHDLRTPPRSAP